MDHLKRQSSVDSAQETVILGGVLQEMVKHAYDWRPQYPGTAAHRAEQTLKRLLDEDRLRREHLPMIFAKLLRDLPVSAGRGGPHDTLLDILREFKDPSIIPFAEELFYIRVERGLDDDQVLGLLATRADDPDAVSTLVTLIVEFRPRQGSNCLLPLGSVAANGPLCFPALASLVDVPEYADAVLNLAVRFYKKGSLPEKTIPYIAAGIEQHETALLTAYLRAAEDFRDTTDIIREQAHLMDLAENLIDQPEVEEIIRFVAEYGNHQLALPAILVLLTHGREVAAERLSDVASHPVHGRRELRAQLSGIGRLDLFPADKASAAHWGETEIAEWMDREGFPVGPNAIWHIGCTHWDDAPVGLEGWYLLYLITAVTARDLRRSQGDFERYFLAASGPLAAEPDSSPIGGWLTQPGTYVHLEDLVLDQDYENAWQLWCGRHPSVR